MFVPTHVWTYIKISLSFLCIQSCETQPIQLLSIDKMNAEYFQDA